MADEAAHEIFIGSVAKDVTVDQLSAHLASLGVSAAGVRLLQNADGTSKGCAIASFDSAEASTAAISSIDNSTLNDVTISARPDRYRNRKPREQPKNEDSTLVYVGGLKAEASEAELRPAFEKYGTINEVQLHLTRRRENQQAWAVLQFASQAEAKSALAANGSQLGGNEIVVEALKHAPRPKREPRERKPREKKPRAERTKAKKSEKAETGETPAAPKAPPTGSLHVGNVSWDASEDELRQLFAAHGTVESVEIARERVSKRSLGWGTVKMADEKQAEAALAAVNGTELHERALTVEIKKKVSVARAPRQRKQRAKKAKEDSSAADAPAAAEGDEAEASGRRRRKRERKPRERKEPEAVANPECHLFVGNLAWDATEEGVRGVFAGVGEIASISISAPRRNRKERARGWANVVMKSGAEASAAIAKLNGATLQERELIVRADTRVVKAE